MPIFRYAELTTVELPWLGARPLQLSFILVPATGVARLCLSFSILWGALCPQASALDFPVGPLYGRLDLTASYGMVYRTSDPNDDLVATANGGSGSSVNSDDGTLNYRRGITANVVGANAALSLKRGIFTAYMQGYAFHDFEQENGKREHRPFTSEDLDVIGTNAKLREAYLEGKFSVADVPLMIRIGEQVINWGESVFPRHGVDVISPLDGIFASQPLRFPGNNPRVAQGMLWGVASLTENVAIEAFYQYEWEPVLITPAGHFFSTSDIIGEGNDKFIQLGGGVYSDLGTDLDASFSLPTGTLGFDDSFQQISQLQDGRPDDGGQYGAAIMWVGNRGNAAKWGLHYTRYHSRLPLISGFTADQVAIDATSDSHVDARAEALVPVYLDQGWSLDDSKTQAQFTAEQTILSDYSNEAGYFVEYPEDISMLALTFNTATLRTGTLVTAELSHHMDAPLQVDSNEVVAGVLSPVRYDPRYAQGSLGEFGASTTVPGYVRKDRTQFSVSLLQLFGRRLGATQSLLGADIAYAHIHDFPGSGEPSLNAREGGTRNSWGYRMLATLTYNNVLGALNLSPSIAFSHDVHGNTPGPYSAFRKGRKLISVGARASYINRLSAELRYTNFFGGGHDNPIIDRDNIRFTISYGF